MKVIRILVGVFCMFIAASSLHAALAYVEDAKEITYTVKSGTTGGSCHVKDLGNEGIQTVCKHGANFGKFNTLTGCVETNGLGFCAKGVWPDNPPRAALQLNCTAEGEDYNLGTGSGGGSCGMDGGTMTCTETIEQTTNSATANCTDGCQSSTNSGCCCREGTTGCGTGNNCDGGE